jgi:DNA-binding GntR family transcriptional regulator
MSISQPRSVKQGSHVDRIYHQLRQMAMNYQFRPGESLNETDLAASLNVSRTPLREVLNRLVAEGLLEFVPRRGFSGRPLEAKMIYDLYEMRSGLEVISARFATQRASDAELEDLVAFWQQASQQFSTCSAMACVQFDEEFHERLARLSQNLELLNMLRMLNARVHFLRFISMEQAGFRRDTCGEHAQILAAIQQRQPDLVSDRMYAHVMLRREQLVDVIKEGIARIYMGNAAL